MRNATEGATPTYATKCLSLFYAVGLSNFDNFKTMQHLRSGIFVDEIIPFR